MWDDVVGNVPEDDLARQSEERLVELGLSQADAVQAVVEALMAEHQEAARSHRPADEAQALRLLVRRVKRSSDRAEQEKGKLVLGIARKFVHAGRGRLPVESHEGSEDVEGDLVLAMLRALETFDSTRGFERSTYIWPVSENHLRKKHIRTAKKRSMRFIDLDEAPSASLAGSGKVGGSASLPQPEAEVVRKELRDTLDDLCLDHAGMTASELLEALQAGGWNAVYPGLTRRQIETKKKHLRRGAERLRRL